MSIKIVRKVEIREVLEMQQDIKNKQDKNAVAVVRDGEEPCRIPRALARRGSRIICHFLTKA